jgi:small-conductance mechanosensitive channel
MRGHRTHPLMRVLVLILVAGFALPAPSRAQETPVPEAEATVATAPVEIDGATLFRVRGGTSFPAELRARTISDRIVRVASDRAIPADAIRIAQNDQFTQIVAGNIPIMAVVDADASLEQIRLIELAEIHRRRIQQAIVDYRAAREPAALRRGVVNFLVATLLLLATIAALLWLWRRADRFLMHRLQARIHSVQIQALELLRAERIWAAVRHGILLLRAAVFLIVALVYLEFALAQFPRTRGLSANLAAFALEPFRVIGGGIATHATSLIFLAVLFIVIRVSLRLIRLFFEAVGRGTVSIKNFDADWAESTYKIVRIAIIAFALIVAYPYIPGSNTDAFKGISLFIGVIFSLGSSSAIANIIAGYMLTYRRALKVGDRVKIGAAFGDVIETRLQVTHLRSFKNEEIIIPNSQILAGDVINYSSLSRRDGIILHTEVGIGYETPWRQVEAMLLEAARRTGGLSTNPPPFVLMWRLGDFAVVYELNAYCLDVKAMARMYTEMHRNILDVFNEYGVQIMTPAYEGDPEKPKIVDRQDWYTAPSVRPSAATPT